MTTDRALDLSLRRVFAILISYWIAYWLAITPMVWLSSGGPPVLGIAQYLVLVALAGAALTLVLWPTQQGLLSRWSLPVAVALCTLAFLIERHWFLLQGNAPNATPGQLMHAHVLRQDFILLVLIVAWQFRYRVAIAYTLAITLAEGALVAIADLANPLLSGITQRELVVRCLIFLLIAYAVNRLIQRQRQQRAELQAANARLASFASTVDQLSASQERNRLSRELHDTLAHSLSALVVQLEAVDSVWPRDAAAARTLLNRAQDTARDGLTDSRRALQALRAAPLEAFGLLAALRGLCESAAQRTGAQCRVSMPDSAPPLDAAMEQATYRIAQEALENITRHAQARNIELLMDAYVDGDTRVVRLRVNDDGRGFDARSPGAAAESGGRLGLRGMYERARLLGGELWIDSASGSGSRVTLLWRLNHERHGQQSGARAGV